MIFGYSTNAFVRFTLFGAVSRISRLGFQGVEIMCDRPHLYPPDFGEHDLARLKELIRQHGLKVTNLNSFTLFAVGDTYLPSWIEPEEGRRRIRIVPVLTDPSDMRGSQKPTIADGSRAPHRALRKRCQAIQANAQVPKSPGLAMSANRLRSAHA